MRKFKVTLEQQERDSLVAITQKGAHQSRKVLNALIGVCTSLPATPYLVVG